MKLEATRDVIAAYAEGLQEGGAAEVAACLKQIGNFVSQHPDLTMVQLVDRVSRGRPSLNVKDRPKRLHGTTASALSALQQLGKLVDSVKSNAPVRNDLEQLYNLLATQGDSGDLTVVLDLLRTAMINEITDPRIEAFARKLKQETGTAEFERTLSDLKASPLTRLEVVAIAAVVYGPIKKGTSRIGALAFIRKPHDAFVTTKRGLEATGGRSAA